VPLKLPGGHDLFPVLLISSPRLAEEGQSRIMNHADLIAILCMIMVQRWNPQEPSIVIPDKWKT